MKWWTKQCSCDKKRIIEAERFLCKKLDYNLHPVTVNSFTNSLMELLPFKDTHLSSILETVMDVQLVHKNFARIPVETVSLACLAATCHIGRRPCDYTTISSQLGVGDSNLVRGVSPIPITYYSCSYIHVHTCNTDQQVDPITGEVLSQDDEKTPGECPPPSCVS